MSLNDAFSSRSVERDFRFLAAHDFMTFVEYVFRQLHPQAEFVDSPHLSIVAGKLEECVSGRCKRLIICLPPRSLKSIMTSVALPAWLLGKFPEKQIICASYGQDLADKHARDTRNIMMGAGYQRIFPARLSRSKLSVNEFTTTAGGFRMATSVGGVLTGRGGDILIIDDPLKPADAYSETARNAVNNWYDNTLRSRLNNKRDGVIIIVMQRLHQDDLVGHLLDKESWDVLKLPAIAQEDEVLHAETTFGPVSFKRKVGEPLDPAREPKSVLEELRTSMGNYVFEAQYQQNPQPEGGAIIRTAWLCYCNPNQMPQSFSYKIQSWDTANKSGEANDFSVCTTWGVLNKSYFLLDVYRARLEFPELRRTVLAQRLLHSPSRIIVEDKGSGTQILQDLRREGIYVTPYSPPPGNDKQMRLMSQSAVFEAGRVFLPHSAPWLAEYVRELTSFPQTKFDDQVDSTTQALDHLNKASSQGVRIQELRM